MKQSSDLLSGIPTNAFGVAGIAGPVVFTAVVIIQGLIQPDYSAIRMPISALGAWPLGWLQEMNCAVLGVSLIAFGAGLHRAVTPGRTAKQGGAGAALLVTGGFGMLLAGAFSWKTVNGIPTETPLHVVAGITAIAASAFGFIRIANRLAADSAWKDLAMYTRVTGFAMLAIFVTIGLLAADEGKPLHDWSGAIQRGLFLVWFACVIVLSGRLMRSR